MSFSENLIVSVLWLTMTKVDRIKATLTDDEDIYEGSDMTDFLVVKFIRWSMFVLQKFDFKNIFFNLIHFRG